MAVAIIGLDNLKNSSVTGKKCNRTNSQPKIKIDSNLLSAVYGCGVSC